MSAIEYHRHLLVFYSLCPYPWLILEENGRWNDDDDITFVNQVYSPSSNADDVLVICNHLTANTVLSCNGILNSHPLTILMFNRIGIGSNVLPQRDQGLDEPCAA